MTWTTGFGVHGLKVWQPFSMTYHDPGLIL